MRENIILNIQSKFVNGSDISESIRKGAILDLINKIPFERITAEDEPISAALEN